MGLTMGAFPPACVPVKLLKAIVPRLSTTNPALLNLGVFECILHSDIIWREFVPLAGKKVLAQKGIVRNSMIDLNKIFGVNGFNCPDEKQQGLRLGYKGIDFWLSKQFFQVGGPKSTLPADQ
jgi:hypothetical protein